jgi:hypothetical protein
VTEKLTVKERLVPLPVVQDSALVRMMLECDSANNALVAELETVKSTAVETAFKQRLNGVEIRFKTIRDTVYLRATDTIRQEPVVVEVEKEVNVLKWWQKTLMALGIMMILIIIIKLLNTQIK